MFRYATRYISRSEMASSPGPSFSGTQLRGTPSPSASVHGTTESNAATLITGRALYVEDEGSAQSTWKANGLNRSVANPETSSSASRKVFGEPVGGSVEPSRSDGSWPP